MRIGLQVFASQRDGNDPLRDAVAQAALAERLGFDTVWLAEHHRTPWNTCPDTLTFLSHIAGSTERIRLGTAVVNLVLQHPIAVAERARLVDALSGGRLELGISRGFSSYDYSLFAVDSARNQEIFVENHGVLLESLSSTEPDLQPPLAQPAVPVWLAVTGSKDSIDLAVRHGHGVLLAGNGDKLDCVIKRFRGQWQQRHDHAPNIAITRAVHVAETFDEAYSEMVDSVRWYISQNTRLIPGSTAPPVNEVLDGFCIFGSPEQCRRSIERLHAETGMSQLNCVFGIGGARPALTHRSMRRFASEVMPGLEHLR